MTNIRKYPDPFLKVIIKGLWEICLIESWERLFCIWFLEVGLPLYSLNKSMPSSYVMDSLLFHFPMLAFFFIANRVLNLAVEKKIVGYGSMCSKEAINNVSYENLIISVFSPLAILLYLCPLFH